jgi:hypothetical protein
MGVHNMEVEVDVYAVLSESSSGWLVDVGIGDPIWVPISQCRLEIEDRSTVLLSQHIDGEPIGTIYMPEWLAYDRGLI